MIQDERRKYSRYDILARCYYYWSYETPKEVEDIINIEPILINISASGAALMTKNNYDLVSIGDQGTIQIILIDKFFNLDFEVVRIVEEFGVLGVRLVNIDNETQLEIDKRLRTIAGKK